MNGNRILVTGATGHIGSKLVHALLRENISEIAVITRDTIKTKELFGEDVEHILYESVSFKSNILNFSPNIVIHLASYSTSKDDPDNIKQLIDANILFVSLLFDALKETSVELFLNTGSFAEYFYNDGKLNPAYYYAATKTASRAIVNYYKNLTGVKSCTIIPYTVYGGVNKNKKIIDLIFDSLYSVEAIRMTSGRQISDFVHLDDVVSFYVYAINNMHLLRDGGDYHLGTGKGMSLRDIAQVIENISDKKTNIEWGALEYRATDVMRAIAPIYKLEKELDWMPSITIEKGLSMMWTNNPMKKK
jgi:nucleoside-diphosphate-sugar epimerase